ncbi:hypothetical protein Slin14017_G124060 [Septoria linicola]|nr:hypothetical protein Slin14017_G124060 [Septoria linicola]
MSFFGDRAKLLGTQGTKDDDWGWGAIHNGEGDINFADAPTTAKDSRPRSTIDVDSPSSLKSTINRRFALLKRPGGAFDNATSQDATKRRRIESQAASRRSADSSLFVPATASPEAERAQPKPKTKPAVQALFNNPFGDSDSDDSENDRTSDPAPKPPPPSEPLPSASRLLSSDNRDEALAQSARMRQAAEERRRARHNGVSARPSPALAATNGISGASSQARDTLQARSVQKPGYRLQKHRRNDERAAVKPTAEVINLDSDEDDAPAIAPRPSLQPAAPTSKSRVITKKRRRQPASSVQQPKQPTSFKERLSEVKKEWPTAPTKQSQLNIAPSIELLDEDTMDFETDDDKRKRQREEAARLASERMDQEQQRGKDRAKALVEQQRQKQEVEAAAKRREEERTRTQLSEEAEARKAAIERQRQQDLATQRQKDVDAQHNKSIQEQLARMREEKKQRKAAEEAEKAKKKAEDDANRETERLRSIEEKRAELARRPPVLSDQARQERDERIRLKKERAARNKQAQRDDEENDGELILEDAPDAAPKSLAARAREAQVIEESNTLTSNNDDDPAVYTPTPTLAAKPMSLNSAAGLRALSNGTKPMRQIPGTAATQRDRSSHGRVLGEILVEDASILKWRDTGSPWDQIKEKYFGMTGKTRAADTLRARHQQVSKALSEANVNAGLRQRMLDGDEEARKEVNIAVHGEWPLTRGTTGARPVTETDDNNHADDAARGTLPAAESGTPHVQTVHPLARGTIPPGSLAPPGELLPIDARLYLWRKTHEMTWPQVINEYQSLIGVRKSQHVLKQRFEEVEGVFDDVWLQPDEIEALANDEPGIRAKVNGKMCDQWPPPLNRNRQSTATTSKKPRGRPPKETRNDSAVGGPIRLPPRPAASPERRRGTFHATESGLFTPVHPEDEAFDAEHVHQRPRRSTGGKTPSWKAMQQFQNDLIEVFQHAEDHQADDYHSEVDPDDPDDYCYWVFRVMRRDYTPKDEEEDIDIESVIWRECDVMENLDEANQAANQEMWSKLPGLPAYTEGNFDSVSNLIDGLFRQITVVTSGVGQLDIQVTPYKRTIKDGILPKSKGGWLNSTVYIIMQQTFTRKYDAVLGERSTEKETIILNGTLTSYLPLANERAIAIFLDITRKRLSRLDADAADREERAKYFQEELEEHEDGEDAKFDKTHVRNEDKSIRIWVSPQRMCGPRNMFQFAKGSSDD